MGDFILRKSEAFTRAQQSMARYMKEQNITSWTSTTPWSGTSRRRDPPTAASEEESNAAQNTSVAAPSEPSQEEEFWDTNEEQLMEWSWFGQSLLG